MSTAQAWHVWDIFFFFSKPASELSAFSLYVCPTAQSQLHPTLEAFQLQKIPFLTGALPPPHLVAAAHAILVSEMHKVITEHIADLILNECDLTAAECKQASRETLAVCVLRNTLCHSACLQDALCSTHCPITLSRKCEAAHAFTASSCRDGPMSWATYWVALGRGHWLPT